MKNHNGNWIPAFLDALANTGVVAEACRLVGVSRSAVTGRCKTDADFAAAFDDAMEQALDLAEQELWKRAVHGYDEPVIYKGQISREVRMEHDELTDEMVPVRGKMVTVRKKSDDLLKFLLSGRRKNVFASRTELTGADGKPLDGMDEQERAARIAQLMALAKQRAEDAEDVDDLV